MKQIHVFILTSLIVFSGFAFGGSLMAQESEKVNVKKELNKVLKDLPADVQMQILKYAERKRDAIAAAKVKQEAAANKVAEAKPEQAKAMPQPQKAQPVEIKAAPAQSAAAEAPTKQAPKPTLPTYMQQAQEMPQTEIAFPEDSYNYGKVESGEVVTHTFKFTNTGNEPLKLTRVKASCGCTTPKWSQEAVQPGEEGFIDVSFNTRGKAGVQTKSITVTGNFTGNTKILRISGEVERPATETPGSQR